MAWLDRIWRRTAPTETRDKGFAELSRALAEAYGGTGGPVSPAAAERHAAAAACINLIAGSIASLPASIMLDGAPAPANLPAWKILRRPNPMQSWPGFIGLGTRSLLLRGNFLARIDEDGRGAPIGATMVPWSWCTPRVLVSSTGGSARLAYDVQNKSAEAVLLGLPARLLSDEVCHCRLNSDDGITGRSMISRAGAALREGLSMQTAAQSSWDSGMRPSAVFKIDKFLPEPQRKRFDEETRDKLVGAINAGGWALLEGGMDVETLSMTSTDAQFIENRVANVDAVCAIFSCPSILIRTGAHAVADLAPYISAFSMLALTPIVAEIEHQFSFAVFGPDSGLRLSLDMDGLQRGSFASVVAALCALLQSGAITPNDVRGELSWPAIAGGDELRPSNAPNWPADGPGSHHLGPSPGPRGGDNLPAPGTHQDGGAA